MRCEETAVTHIVESRMKAVTELCRTFHVRSLALFGSATGGEFVPGSSDLDFVVEFELLPPAEHADAYFGLISGLERLFGMRVDMVEAAAVTNPYLLQSIQATQEVLYAAA
jgi:hypothetical protein